MRPDALEGNVYSLPRCLSFDIVKNLEELSSLEMSSLLSEPASDVSISLWVKVVWEVNLIRRATEEEETVMNELKAIERCLKEEHSLIQHHLSSVSETEVYSASFRTGCVHLLKRKLLQCEASLLNFSKTVSKYHTVALPLLELFSCDNQSFDFYLSPSDPVSNAVDIFASDSDSDLDEEDS